MKTRYPLCAAPRPTTKEQARLILRMIEGELLPKDRDATRDPFGRQATRRRKALRLRARALERQAKGLPSQADVDSSDAGCKS